jgi:hypothetical protein
MSRRRRPSAERPGQNPFELVGPETLTDGWSRAGVTAPPTEACTGAREPVAAFEDGYAVPARASCGVFIFFLVERLAGEQDSAVEGVR